MVTVAPAEFPDGGRSFQPEWAIARGVELMRARAGLIEVGGQVPHRGAAPLPLAGVSAGSAAAQPTVHN